MSSTLIDDDSHMVMTTTSSNTPTPTPDEFDDPIDPIDPDTPPQTSTQSLFPQQLTSGQTTQTPQMSSATLNSHSIGMETPSPSAMRLAHSQQILLTPGPTGTPPPSQLQLQRDNSMGGQLERKSAAEDWAAVGWGGKKLVEEYELQKDKLLDSGLDLTFLGDDYDERDMWQ